MAESQENPAPSHDAEMLLEKHQANLARTRGKVLPAVWGVVSRLLLIAGFLMLVLLIPYYLQTRGMTVSADTGDYLIVIALGMLVGFVEVISRYQDAPFVTAMTWPGLFYMLVNGSVAAVALWMVRLFGWQVLPGGETNAEVERWTEVIVAGLGAMAIFRSSLFVIGKEEQEVSIGPSAILDILLNAIDKEVDRQRGKVRAQSIKSIMENIAYEDAIADLTVISKALMQNLRAEDSKKIDDVKTQIELVQGIDPDVRKYLLGLRIMDVVGEDLLKQAIEIRGREYYKQAPSRRKAEEERKKAVLEGLGTLKEGLITKLASEPSSASVSGNVITTLSAQENNTLANEGEDNEPAALG